jgi:hypothetical protein
MFCAVTFPAARITASNTLNLSCPRAMRINLE